MAQQENEQRAATVHGGEDDQRRKELDGQVAQEIFGDQGCSKEKCDAGGDAAYYLVMHMFLTVLVGILMLATLGVLLAGMVGMVREGNPRRSNKLMQWRVLLQGLTILLFMILMSLLRS